MSYVTTKPSKMGISDRIRILRIEGKKIGLIIPAMKPDKDKSEFEGLDYFFNLIDEQKEGH